MSWFRPPQSAELLAAAVLPDAAEREAFLGDLAEEYQEFFAQQGAYAADRWYWSQVGRSLIPLLIMALRPKGALGSLRCAANVVSSLVAIGTHVVLSFSAAGWLWAVLIGGEYIDGVLAFGRSPFVYPWWALTCAFAGLGTGYSLARFGGSSGAASAIAVGIACIPLGALTVAAAGGDAQAWFEACLCAVILPATICGALLHVRCKGLTALA